MFRIAGPAMLANITTPLLGIVATGVVGNLGDTVLLSGVALASVVFDTAVWLFAFLRMGTIALAAQAFGAQDRPELDAVLLRGLLAAWLFGLVLAGLQVPLWGILIPVLGPSQAVAGAARSYLAVRTWSAPFVLSNMVLLGWFVGQARARLALLLQVGVNLVNIAATVALVTVAGLGMRGAAGGALVAEAAGFCAGLAAVRLAAGISRVPWARVLDGARLRRMFAVERDIMIRTASVIAALLMFVGEGARLGDRALAANAVLQNFIMIGSFFLDGIASAAEQLCGQTSGAGDAAGFRRAVRLVLGWSAVFGVVATVLFLLGGAWLIAAIAADPQVRADADAFLPFAALTPVCGVLAFACDGIYIGGTWTRDMRNLMLLAFLVYLAAWITLRPFGNSGLWTAWLGFFAARGVLQLARLPRLLRAAFPSPAAPSLP